MFGTIFYWLHIITGNNENDGRSAESHFLLGPVCCFLGHDYRSYWFFTLYCWPIFQGPLEFQEANAEELQKASSKLGRKEKDNVDPMYHFLAIYSGVT